MANNRRRRRFGRSRSLGRTRPRWTADFFDVDLAAGTLGFQRVITVADYQTSGTLEAESTVLRTIVTGDLVPTAAGTATVNFGLYHGTSSHFPTFGGVMDPGTVGGMVSGDLLWCNQQTPALDIDAFLYAQHLEADIRVKRKLEADDELIFVCSNAAGGTAISIRITIRILIIVRV